MNALFTANPRLSSDSCCRASPSFFANAALQLLHDKSTAEANVKGMVGNLYKLVAGEMLLHPFALFATIIFTWQLVVPICQSLNSDYP